MRWTLGKTKEFSRNSLGQRLMKLACNNVIPGCNRRTLMARNVTLFKYTVNVNVGIRTLAPTFEYVYYPADRFFCCCWVVFVVFDLNYITYIRKKYQRADLQERIWRPPVAQICRGIFAGSAILYVENVARESRSMLRIYKLARINASKKRVLLQPFLTN